MSSLAGSEPIPPPVEVASDPAADVFESVTPFAARGFWLADFKLAKGRVRVFDTGADLAFDRTLVGECLIWLGYHVVVRVRSWWLASARRDHLQIWFTPSVPRPWYLVWAAAAWAGIRIVATQDQADVAFAFEDATWSAALAPSILPAFNFRCSDISKSRVARIFEQVFGYPLAVDPMQWSGPAVDKSERNGVHDGRLIDCPAPAQSGRHYQRLIDTRQGDVVRDLRTACVGGRPVAVWIKRKPAHDRFSIHNLTVTLHEPSDVFNARELNQIARFLARMNLDWAGLDILRDRSDGRIYVVDVNTTDVGPIIALSLGDKLRSTAILGRALRTMIQARQASGQRGASRIDDGHIATQDPLGDPAAARRAVV